MSEIPMSQRTRRTIRQSVRDGKRLISLCARWAHVCRVTGSPRPATFDDGERGVRLSSRQDVHNQPGHIVHMYELKLMLKVMRPGRQQERQTGIAGAHAVRQFALTSRYAAQRTDNIVLHCWSHKDRRPQDIGLALQTLDSRLNGEIGLTLVKRISQRMGLQRRIFG